MNEKPILWLLSLVIVVSSGVKDAAGVTITKYASGAHRSTIITSRIVIVWIISVTADLEKFLPLQVIGFVILVSGILVYNEIIIIPLKSMNEGTKQERINKIKQEE
jgi:hypothetical protein